MRQLLTNLFARLGAASATQKAIAGIVVVLAIAAVGVGGWLSSRPHWEVLLSELSDKEFARVGEALSSSGVRWHASQPPRPFVVYVARADRGAALNAIMQAGALDGSGGGILTSSSGGVGSVFLYSKEREQLTRKKEWEDMEAMLEFQDFIREARVRTSIAEPDRLGRDGVRTASVTLVLAGASGLSRSQERTVADLVRLGLGVEAGHLVVSDQTGHTLFNGEAEADGSRAADEWMERAKEEDERLAEEANRTLEEILGPGLARVTVRSDWDLDQIVELTDRADPKQKAALTETKRTTQTPHYGPPSIGGPGGTSANVATGSEFGVDSAGVIDLTSRRSSAPEPTMGKTSEESATYAPTRTLAETVRSAPERLRMSVSLWLDESLAGQRSVLEQAVRAAVGFDERRNDQFESALVPFAKPEEGAEEIAPPEEGVSPMLELLLTRGVEAVAALFFLVVLMLSLRKGKQGRAAESAELEPRAGRSGAGTDGEAARETGGETEPEVDPELVALERVRKLVDEEPEKVGELLSAWARGEDA